jgi:signal transduction histidine kinase
MAPLAQAAPAAWRRPSFLVVLAAAATLLAISGAGAVRSYGHPLAGVFVDSELVVSSVGWPSWSGVTAGLRYPDRVVSIDGADVSAASGAPLADRRATWERAVEAGAREHREVHLEVSTSRDGSPAMRGYDLAVVPFDGGAWWTQAASLIFAAFLYVVAGLVAMATNPSGRLARAFAKTAFFAALFLVTSVDWAVGHRLGPLFYVAFAMLPPAIIVLALRLPDDVSLLRRLPRLVHVLDLAGAALAVAMLVRASRGLDTVALRNVCSAALGAALILYGVTLVVRFFLARGQRRDKLRSLLVAMVPAHGAIGVAILLAASASSFSSLAFCSMPAIAFAPLAAVLAFARHDLWSSRALLSRVLTHALLALAAGITAIAGGAALVTTLGVPFTHGLAGAAAGGALAAILVALALRASDHGLFSARADYKPTIEQLSYDLVLVNRPAEVARAVESTVTRWLACRQVRFALANEDPEEARTSSTHPSAIVLALPVTFRGETLGVLHLGAKAGGALYTSEDLDLLRTIVNQTAVALAHARSYGELEDRRQQQIAAMRDERLALIETLAAEVAHEVRYPINFFRSIFDPRRRGDLDAEALEIGGEEVDRLERLVSGLKRVSTHRIERAPVSLRQVVARVEVLLTDRLAGRVNGDALPDAIAPEVTLACDFDQLTQVLVNLLANALDAAGTPDDVGIAWNVDERGDGEIVVWDGGAGFDVDEAELFAPWFTTKPRGTGLGLAVSQRIVRTHGWSINARRHNGRTEFRIGIPAGDLTGSASSGTRDAAVSATRTRISEKAS